MTVSINGVYSHNYKDGVLVKETLSAASEAVARGHYAATTLSAVDADLAVGNIKNGITLFGFAGSADGEDISDATAIEAEVLAPETFYAVSGGIRTGTMPIVALNAGSNAYPAGYHAGNVGGLDAVDVDLATANIKNGITIFNVAGSDMITGRVRISGSAQGYSGQVTGFPATGDRIEGLPSFDIRENCIGVGNILDSSNAHEAEDIYA